MNVFTHVCDKYHIVDTNKKIIEIPGTNRNTFALLLSELGFNIGVEIGVECGIYSETLLNSNKNLILYSVDAWTAYKGYRDHVSQDKVDVFYQKTKDRLAEWIKISHSIVIKGFSMDVVKEFADNSMDFAYIDGNHEYQQTVNDIAEWHKKVRVGGIVAGHDYVLRKDPGYLMHVPYAVNGWCDSYGIQPLFILGAKNDPKTQRDGSRSWFYVKSDDVNIIHGSGDKILT